jgi:hypothetical protein
MSEQTHDDEFRALTKSEVRPGAAAGGLIGGTVGGMLGGVASLGTVITGLGLVVVGPALAFAAAGGLIGGLVGAGVPQKDARRLRDAIQHGQALIALHPANAEQKARISQILSSAQAEIVEL